MKKRKMIILISSVIVIISLIAVLICFYNQKVIVQLRKDLIVEYGQSVKNLSFIKEVKNGKIITKEKSVDTHNLGSKNIKILLKNKLGKKQVFRFKIKIIDSVPPEISYKDEIAIEEKTEVNLLDNVSAKDNVDKEVEVKVEGEYDFNQVGTYTLYYVAVDKSGNQTKKPFKLVVNKKALDNNLNNNQSKQASFTTAKGFNGYIINGNTYIDGILIANKTYKLSSSYGSGLTADTSQAFNTMKLAAQNENINIYIISGFRSYGSQQTIYNNYVARDGVAEADRYSARPGHSEHQTGLAIDINSLETSFENTPEGIWLNQNSYKYGFILRYTKAGESQTGYMYEPWHFRYVGVDLATKLYNNGNWITLEDYFGITSSYQ